MLARSEDRRALPGRSPPDDIGAAVAFPASSAARFITGAILPTAGGITADSGQPRFPSCRIFFSYGIGLADLGWFLVLGEIDASDRPRARGATLTVADITERQAVAWLRGKRRFVQALLVEVLGSAPLPPGAMMLFGDGGEIEGSITGGCVEGALATEAAAILAGERGPGVVSYGISDELAGTVGLTCGGTVRILLAELDGEAGEVELAALEEHLSGRPAAVATVLHGSSAGTRIGIIGGQAIGSLGGSDLLDHNVGREASGLLVDAKTSVRRFGRDGATLGDGISVHVRSYAPAPRMIIFGAVDFSAAMAPFASRVGYEVTIFDARERFVHSRRFSSDAEVRVGWPQELMRGVVLGPRDVVLVFSHDPKYDEPAVLAALATDAGYIGALGSRRTTEDRDKRLRVAGASEADLARVHAPCGLDIGSRTAEETVVSILAEIIASRSQRAAVPLRASSGPIHGWTGDRPTAVPDAVHHA